MRNDNTFADAVAVTLHDTNENVFAGLYVGGAGNLKVTTEAGTAVTFSAVPVGTILPIRTKLIWSTGSTATLVTGFKG